ncbi:2Fe-2S iron-sulfur cluster-binding protein [Cohnella suwonensis]|uniref:2Fe-2S iron-sulfur cluster-binding protein n=1 Tax=Cohnella suwonensis TaxID=696072 RepID=A0ABW0LPR0_9BACL
MSKTRTVTFLPDGIQVAVRPGTTLLEASRRAGVPIRTRCGGVAGCLMCKVNVPAEHAGALLPPTEAETRKLGSQLEEGFRLSCQARVAGDAEVVVPEDPLKAAIRKKLAEQNEEDDWFR